MLVGVVRVLVSAVFRFSVVQDVSHRHRVVQGLPSATIFNRSQQASQLSSSCRSTRRMGRRKVHGRMSRGLVVMGSRMGNGNRNCGCGEWVYVCVYSQPARRRTYWVFVVNRTSGWGKGKRKDAQKRQTPKRKRSLRDILSRPWWFALAG